MNENKRNPVKDLNEGFSIGDIFTMMKNHMVAIIIITVIATVLSFVKVAFFTADTYTATGVIYVSSKDEENISSNMVQMNDMVAGMTMAATYIETLKTRSFLESVSDDINNKYNYKQIASMLTLSLVGETELIGIKTTSYTPEDAYEICQSVLENAKEKLHEIYPGGSIKIVESAYFPEQADGKGVVLKTLIGIIAGLILGGAYAFICTLLDVTLRKAADVKKRYDIPVLGEVPKKEESKNKKKTYDLTANILNDDSEFNLVETYKAIRTNIMFSIPKSDKGNVIAVTSASPGEGKTTTTSNIAITFAQLNAAKVILVDCDLRKSKMHKYLDVNKDKGITSVLCGFCELDDAIQKNAKDNLDVLVAGAVPPNPAELLTSDAFDKMIEELREKYDYIFIDTPPITVVTDATIILPKCQGVVVVAKEDSTNIHLLDETILSVRNTGVTLLGSIVISSEKTNGKYGNYKKMGYQYYYANDTHKEND